MAQTSSRQNGLQRGSSSTSEAQASSTSKKTGFRRSLSNVGDLMRNFGQGHDRQRPPPSAAAAPPPSHERSADQTESASGDGVPPSRSKRYSLNRLEGLRSWGSATASTVASPEKSHGGSGSGSSSGMKRSSSASSNLSVQRGGAFGEALRNFRQRASQFGNVPETPDEAPASTAKPLTRSSSTSRYINRLTQTKARPSKPPNLPTTTRPPVTFDQPSAAPPSPPPVTAPSAQSEAVASTPTIGGAPAAPPTPKITIEPTSAETSVPPSSPTKPTMNAPRLSFGGDQIIDSDWGDLTGRRVSGPAPESVALEVDERRPSAAISDISSQVEILQAEKVEQAPARLINASGVSPPAHGLVQVKDGEGRVIGPDYDALDVGTGAAAGPPPSESEDRTASSSASPARSVSKRTSMSSLKERNPLKRLISSESWRKLSRSGSETSIPNANAASTEEETPAANGAPSERSTEGSQTPRLDSVDLPRSAAQSSFAESKGDRLVSGNALSTRIAGNRSASGQPTSSLEVVGAEAFTRREGSAVDSLHRLSVTSSMLSSSPHSNRSSPTTSRVPS